MKKPLVILTGPTAAVSYTHLLAEFKYPTHQISFHTLSALDCLKYVKSEVIYD